MNYALHETVADVLWDSLIDARKELHDLQDEVTRLRAAMPADALREFDRRHKDGS